jgi:E3 ubiquitin-protein ligase RGLG
MGCGKSKPKRVFVPIPDKYETVEEVSAALRDAGITDSNLIFAVDCTESNFFTGARSFGGRCLHDISPDRRNPYQQAIEIVGRTLEPFDIDKLIPAYGFGDARTRDRSVFPFFQDRECRSFREVLQRYNELIGGVTLAGPTSFAPIIDEAVRITREKGSYHILVIVADGHGTDTATREAIARACDHPLSIVIVGVGDGPFDEFRRWDDEQMRRKWDNVQFLEMAEVMQGAAHPEARFALAALQEIPDQYRIIRERGLLPDHPPNQ